MNDVVRITRGAVEKISSEARMNAGMECCGLLAGRGGLISTVLPAKNVLQSAIAYEIAPEDLFVLFRRMRAEGLDHLGIYHSHPRGDNSPSQHDLERAFYPDAAYLIASPEAAAARPIRAFRIRDGHAHELLLQII
jgi:proteasome lid subunit RPN8/RPN11